MSSYLSRLIDHSGIAIGDRSAVPAADTAPQPLEIESFVEASPTPSPPDGGNRRMEQTVAAQAPARQEASAASSVSESSSEATISPPTVPSAPQPEAPHRPAEVAIEVSQVREAPPPPMATQEPIQQVAIVEVVTVPGSPGQPPTRAADLPVMREARAAGTLAAVRAWVAATPAAGEIVVGTPRAVPLERDGTAAEQPALRRPAEAPIAKSAERYEATQDVHVTIGNIVVTVEAPQTPAPAAAPLPARPVPPARRDAGGSTRLRRHYLRP